MTDVVRIAGAGPSGLAAAITLADAGARVIVHERLRPAASRFPGSHQILADYGEEPRGAQLLDMLGVRAHDLDGQWLTEATFHFESGRDRTLSSQIPYAILLRRGAGGGHFDRLLLDRALDMGVEVREGDRVDPSTCQIAATGPRRVDGMAYEVVFESDSEDRVDVLLAPSLFAGGYAYLFVLRGHGTLGIAALGDYRELESRWELARERFEGRGAIDLRELRHTKHHMNFAIPTEVSSRLPLLVGEAGGFQDFLFGLGLRQALLTGRMAAQSLLGGDSYDTRWQRELLPRMRASAVDRWVYEKGWIASLLEKGPVRDLRETLDRVHRGHGLRRPFVGWAESRRPSGRRAEA